MTACEITNIISEYEYLKNKVERVLDMWHTWYPCRVNFFNVYDNQLHILYNILYDGGNATELDDLLIPINWLEMSDDELKDAIAKRKEELRKSEVERHKIMLEKQREEAERAEYERLKRKFESMKI